MNTRNKSVVIEKDGVKAVATQVSLRGLIKRGWTVVDDGDKEVQKANKAEAKEAQQIEEQEQKLFGSDNKE